jgi:hypothetical protein
MTTEKREVPTMRPPGPNPERSKRENKKEVYEDKIMKIAKSNSKEKAKDLIEKYLKRFKDNIPAGLQKFAKDAILGVKMELPKRLNVDDMNKNAPGGALKRNKGGRVKKQVKKKPKVAGRLAKRGYGISR